MKCHLKSFLISIFTFVMCIITLISCGSNSDETRYVAAKLVDSDMWSIIDVNTGEIIHKDEFKSQPSVIVNKKFVVKNESGLYEYYSVDNVSKPLNSEPFLYATSFNEDDIALVVLKGKPISIINGKCEIFVTLDNSIISAHDFSNGFAEITDDNNKRGYINKKGEIVIKPKYDSSAPFSKDGLAIVGQEINDSTYKYTVIDTKGTELFSFSKNEYKDYGSFINGYLPVQKENNEVILLDKTGKKLCSIGKWDGFIPYWLGFHKDIIVFKEGDAFGLKNKKGDVVLRAKYEELRPLTKVNEKYYLAKKQDKYGVIDNEDHIIIPFDFSILASINKDVFCVGEGKSFSFMDKYGDDLGNNNYTNISFITGSVVFSNYFNADKEARKIIDNITESSFFNTKSGMHLRDFKSKLSGYKYADTHESTIKDYDYPYSFLYAFDRNLSSLRYEYFYGYSFPTSPEYNYDANLAMVAAVNSNYKKFQPGSEEALAKAFDSLIQKKGFKMVEGRPNWFKNEKTGMSVALSYDDGIISILCSYNGNLSNYKAERNPREKTDENEIDFVDYFGLDNKIDAVDTVVVSEVADTVVVSEVA